MTELFLCIRKNVKVYKELSCYLDFINITTMSQFKNFIILILLMLAAVPVYAEDTTRFRQNQNTEFFNTINITAYGEGEILSAYDVRLILPTEGPILWGRDISEVVFGGSAAEKAIMPFNPSFSEDGRIITIPIENDFLSGETLTINGLKAKTYDKEINQSVGLDLNGDGIFDRGAHLFFITSTSVRDLISTYDPANFEATYSIEDNSVQLTWNNPPDYDFNQANLTKFITRVGKTSELQRPLGFGQINNFLDTSDLQEGDVIRYVLTAVDHYGNLSNELEQVITIGEEVIEEPVAPEPTPEPETPSEPEESDDPEINLVSRLFNYYNVRYQIKCLAATANATSSACLWSKIDMVYAQELLFRSDVDVSLSDRDLYLMALRVKWPEARYQTNCIEAVEPANTCPALERSLKRIHYFID